MFTFIEAFSDNQSRSPYSRSGHSDKRQNTPCFDSIFSLSMMTFFFEHFVKLLLILLLSLCLCNAIIESVQTRFTEKKSVATSHTNLQKISKIKCVEKCNKERQNGRCTLAGYDKRTKTCYLSDDDPMNVLDTDDEMTGVFFYEQEVTGITNVFLSTFDIYLIGFYRCHDNLFLLVYLCPV